MAAIAPMARLKRIWQSNTISFASKFKLYKSLVTSILLFTFTITYPLTEGVVWAPNMTSSSIAIKCAPCLLTLKKKKIQPVKPDTWGNLFASPTWSTRATTGCRARSVSLWVHRNLFWQLATNGNSHGPSMWHPTTASLVPGQLGGRVMLWSAEYFLDEQHQRADIPAHARTAHNILLQKRLEEDLW